MGVVWLVFGSNPKDRESNMELEAEEKMLLKGP